MTDKLCLSRNTIPALHSTVCICSSQSGDARRLQMGRPICQHFAPSADRMARRQTGLPVREHFVQYADWTKCRQIGQNVGRWDVPSADVPSADWAKCSQMGPSADGMACLPTFCPICRRDRIMLHICREQLCQSSAT